MNSAPIQQLLYLLRRRVRTPNPIKPAAIAELGSGTGTTVNVTEVPAVSVV